MSGSDPDWSEEHVARGNKFTLQIAVAWLALLATSAALGHTDTIGVVFVGVVALGATWLLAHALFEHVDQLVKTRIAEANGHAGGSGDDAATPSD